MDMPYIEGWDILPSDINPLRVVDGPSCFHLPWSLLKNCGGLTFLVPTVADHYHRATGQPSTPLPWGGASPLY